MALIKSVVLLLWLLTLLFVALLFAPKIYGSSHSIAVENQMLLLDKQDQ